ncbi:MAG: hypothetical protein OSB37_07505 [Acidimicrobiales bacterium]|nr:hypothetical protein [Acidimicrobiales bacterium]
MNTRSAQELLAPLAIQQTNLDARLDTLGRTLDLVRLLDSGPATPPVMP